MTDCPHLALTTRASQGFLDLFGPMCGGRTSLSKFASDVNVDQYDRAIARMEKMLAVSCCSAEGSTISPSPTNPRPNSRCRRCRSPSDSCPWPRAPTDPMSSTATRSRWRVSIPPPSPDTRVGLKARADGRRGSVLGSPRFSPRRRCARKFLGHAHSDLAFTGNYVIQGSYNGLPAGTSRTRARRRSRSATSARRRRATSRSTRICCSCPAEGDGPNRLRRQGVKDTVSKDRIRGIRIFDITRHHEPEEHRQRADVPRLAHPHGAGRSEGQGQRLRLRLGFGPMSARRASCRAADGARPTRIRNTALFRIEVIKVPLAHPQQAAIVSSPRIFNDLARRRSMASRRKTSRGQGGVEAASARGAFIA